MVSGLPSTDRIRVLILDVDRGCLTPDLCAPGVRLVVLDQLDLVGGSPEASVVYETGPRVTLLHRIRGFTESDQIDYVVVGNNAGAGVALAGAVAQSLRAHHACVVWNEYRPGKEAFYARLGYRHFLSRWRLREHFRDYVGTRFNGKVCSDGTSGVPDQGEGIEPVKARTKV